MKDRTKNIIISIGFFLILIIMFLINIITKDKEISLVERRKLAKAPEFNSESILNGDISEDFEDYVIDQFSFRDSLRNIKSFFSMNVFMQKDNNKLFVKNGAIYKMEYPLNEKNVQKTAEKMSVVYEKYLKNMNVYYSVIPEKNYYLNDDHLKLDYGKLVSIMNENLEEMKFIDISSSLSLDDFYKTDIHWRQENLGDVVSKLQDEMNLEKKETHYTKENVGDFYGTYYGQIGGNIAPDEMYILTNDEINGCITFNYETMENDVIYDKDNSSDKYDIYLSGPTPVIIIENPNVKEEKELLLFRDSFGSSLAPLLVQNYSKITLIDLRYISNSLLSNYIEFGNQDVLFLYSTLVINQNILR